ncbi:MAG: sensor histidine kinase [Rhodoferax sp.]
MRLALRPTLCGDANLVQIILTNLIENALKYSAPASPVDVALALDAANPQDALITVANSVGVAGRPDTQQLFEKYYRASGASSHTGSGLGLHLSRHMARRLGGDLQYIAGAERIEFCLRLPLIAKM